jgi:hypothetical protein
MAATEAIQRRPGSEYPPRKRGSAFLFDALGGNRRVRMSKVQSTDSPYCTELRKAGSGRGGARLAARHAMNMSRDLPFPPVADEQRQFEAGRATGRGGFVSSLARSCRARRRGRRVESALSPGGDSCGFSPACRYIERVAPGFGARSKPPARGCNAIPGFWRFPDHGNETALPQPL